MKNTVRDLIVALRSGLYSQGYNSLYNVDVQRYCAGGVAVDVYLSIVHGVASLEYQHWKRTGMYLGCAFGLPTIVQKWYGFQGVDGSFSACSLSLLRMNDHENYSFAEIASALEDALANEAGRE